MTVLGQGLLSKGNILKRSQPHTFVFLHHARFTKEDLPNNPVESYTGYTQVGVGAYMIEASRTSFWSKVLVTGKCCRWRGGHWSQVRWSQWQHVSGGMEVQYGSKCGVWYSQT